jgi:hypothetical protein
MKLTRSSLKNLIKECIVEVLAEGIGADSTESLVSESASPKRSKNTQHKKRGSRRSSHLDSIKFDKKVNEAASSMTDDPVMQSIFADTAKSTLQEQISNGKSVPVPEGADQATRVAASIDPAQVFDGASNWASLAFSENIKPQ